MGSDPPSSNIEIKIHPRRQDNVVHPAVPSPMGVPAASAPPRQQQHLFSEFRPFKRWFPWMVPTFVVANIAMFLITMFINNCPKNSVSCVADFLGRFSFQPLKENPLLGPSSSTWVFFLVFSCLCLVARKLVETKRKEKEKGLGILQHPFQFYP